MAGMLGGQPILILKEGTERRMGREAQLNNIAAARAVAEAVRTTLGPRGMDKMMVDSKGEVLVTNDGVTILRMMDIEHPAAKMVVDVAKAQDDEVGDGTTTAAVLTGELLKVAEDLIEMDVHPTVIARGYRLALERAEEALQDLVHKIDTEDEDLLRKVAETAMTGKGAEDAKDKLAFLAVQAVKAVAEEGEEIDIDSIKIEKMRGGEIRDSCLIQGMVLTDEIVHVDMPRKVKDARIALISAPLEFSKLEGDAEIRISSPDQMAKYLDEEEAIVREMVERIKDVGANVVLCEKGIDDLAEFYLARAGIMAVKQIKRTELDRIARAVGGRVVLSTEDIEAGDLGSAELVEEKMFGGEKFLFITGCKNPKAVSLFLRGGTEQGVSVLERAIVDALRAVSATLEDREVVAGGGSPEVELSLQLQRYAATLTGREQLAVEKFAEALEVVPKTLAENAGLDAIDSLAELRSHHEKDGKDSGLNVYTGEIENMFEKGVIEPRRVKSQALNSATEAALMILRINDVLAASKPKEEEDKEKEGGGTCPPGGPCGMGGMGGMPPMMM